MFFNKNYKVIKGRIPIIVSAPDSVKQVRKEKIKVEDGLTGAIVEYLCHKFHVFGIIRTCNLGDDSNYDNDSISLKYKEEIGKLIEEYRIVYLFDIHGCLNRYGFDIDIGTNNSINVSGKNEEVKEIKSLFSNHLLVEVDKIFVATNPNTVSNYTHRTTGINCLQLELSHDVRSNPVKPNGFIESFERIINYIQRKY